VKPLSQHDTPDRVLDAVAACPAEAGLGGSNGGIFAMSVNHVQPHLVVGDVKAGQCLIPQFRDESDTWPGRSRPPDRTTCAPTGKRAPPGLADLRSGYALAPSVHPRRILILIVAPVSPCLSRGRPH